MRTPTRRIAVLLTTGGNSGWRSCACQRHPIRAVRNRAAVRDAFAAPAAQQWSSFGTMCVRPRSASRQVARSHSRTLYDPMTPVATIFIALALTNSTPPPQDSADARQTILRLEEAWKVAQRNTDTSAFARLLAPDFTFIGTSGSLRDRAGYAGSRTGSWIPQGATFTVTDLRVRIYGATAVVTGREHTTGPRFTGSTRFTHVWVRRRGDWQMVAAQRTAIDPG